MGLEPYDIGRARYGDTIESVDQIVTLERWRERCNSLDAPINPVEREKVLGLNRMLRLPRAIEAPRIARGRKDPQSVLASR